MDGVVDARQAEVQRDFAARVERELGPIAYVVPSALDRMESWAMEFNGRADIGMIAIACALGYLDFRSPDYGWRRGRPALTTWYDVFSQRPSIAQTRPPA